MAVSQEKIKEIADLLECGFRAFIHKTSHEILSFPDNSNSYDMDMEPWTEETDKLESDRMSYMEIDNMSSRDGFKVMENFAASLPENYTRTKLFQALEGKKPFANFKIQIDRSGGYRDMWFDFRKERLIRWVERQMEYMD